MRRAASRGEHTAISWTGWCTCSLPRRRLIKTSPALTMARSKCGWSVHGAKHMGTSRTVADGKSKRQTCNGRQTSGQTASGPSSAAQGANKAENSLFKEQPRVREIERRLPLLEQEKAALSSNSPAAYRPAGDIQPPPLRGVQPPSTSRTRWLEMTDLA